MNYSNIYNQLVTRALSREKIYPTERHHIIPKSMGGKDRKNNVVYFTPHEHLVAHLLLWKIYRNKSMSHALWMMCHTREGIKINGRQYEILRLEHSKNISESLRGRVLSEETKQKIRDANLGREDDGRYIKIAESNRGKKHSEETKKKMSQSSKHTSMSVEHKEKLNKIHTGRIVTEETKQKIREANLGKKASPEAREKMRLSALNRKKLVD